MRELSAAKTSSQDLYARALRTAPGGVHSPVRAFRSVGGTPVFFKSAEGAHLTDVSGRRYIDFCMSFGPLILGHRDAAVARAVHEAVDRGWSFGACEPYSLALAEWILARVPWVERLRFVSSGTEAVMSALRVARAFTNRSHVLKFEGCYHGHADQMLVKAGSGLAGRTAASSAGIAASTAAQTLVAPLDDESELDAIFDANGHDIAAVILEAVPANYGLLPPRQAWLDHLRRQCRERGALLVVDEVITGFRSGLKGASETFGLEPDLVCYGKVIGGGFPVACYGGRADLLDLVAPAGPVYQAGTLSANPVGMSAGLATLEQMSARNGWTELEGRTASFVQRLSGQLAGVDPDLEVVHHASMFWIRKRAEQAIRRPDRIPAGQAEWYREFFHAALARGVYLPPSGYEVGFLSLAHDEATLAAACDALTEAARQMAHS
jgi:glutamate-1-semialdehyde 2,1-aminomutase